MTGERIELHVGLLDAVDTPQSFDACRAVLSPEEERRAERFAFDRHRHQYIFAHGLLRFALSGFVPQIDPSDWSFASDRYGRPFIAGPKIAGSVCFSLSHTDGCVACAVSGHKDIGVDVERVHRRGSLMATAETAFSPEEIETLRGLPPDEFVDRFFDYWTLKEAYVKASGRGLSFSLSRFSMLIGADETRISFAPEIADDPRRWRFTRSSPSPTHRLAIADGTGVTGGLPVILGSWPLPRHAAESDELRKH